MKIAIVGAGFTGLAAAWDMIQAGHQVTIFEANAFPGGLAAGFKDKKWNWSLEHHYHHIFTGDNSIRTLISEMGLDDLLFYSSVKTSTRYQNLQFQLDSPISLLKNPVLSLNSKLRTGATLAFLRVWPFWQIFENITAEKFIKLTMGEEAWKILWQPLFLGKFGTHTADVNASWFWSRIHVRSAQLGYFKGGFLELANGMVDRLKEKGVKFQFNTSVQSIESVKNRVRVNKTVFDKVLVTGPAPLFTKLVKNLPAEYIKTISQLKGLAAVTLVLELDQPFFNDGSYWLNINEKNWPILAVVEHTQLAGTQNYDGHTIVYVGKYLEMKDKQFSLSKDALIKLYTPFLKKLSPTFSKHIVNSWVFHAPFAQPIVTLNHAAKVPSIVTPVNNVYWSSLQHVYPWDRGTNYAVLLGRRAAHEMLNV